MNKFIFLDVDGVLNNEETYTLAPYGGTGIDDYHIYRLKQLVDNTGAQIILSSDWKFNSPNWPFNYFNWDPKECQRTWTYLNKHLENYGLTITDFIPHHCQYRGNEITMYIADKLPCQYVILDDLPLNEFKNHLPHLVHTNPKIGLTWEDVWEAQEKMKIVETEIKI